MSNVRFFRKVEAENLQDLAARILAVQCVADNLQTECVIEPLWFDGQNWTFSRTVRIVTDNPTPFKEILDAPLSKVYEYLKEENNKLLSRQGRKMRI